MAYASRAGRARTSVHDSQAHAICDRCGFRYNRIDLRFQFDWRGAAIQNTNALVCNKCYDTPQEQLRAITVPADPMPVINPRVQDFVTAEANSRQVSGGNTVDPVTGIPVIGGDLRATEDDALRSTQQTGAAPGSRNQQPGTNPNAPGNSDPGLPPGNADVPQTGPLE